MTRRLASALLMGVFSLVSVGATADVTLKSTMTLTGPASVEGAVIVYLKGTKMRTDLKSGGQDVSVVVDLATKEQLLLNHVAKEIQTVDPLAAMGAMPVTLGEATISVKPTGEKKEILGRQCQGFGLSVSMPMTIGGETIMMVMTGPAWVATDGPGAAEYQQFFKTAAAAGISASPLAQGPQGKGLGELQNALFIQGIALEQDLHISAQGTGQMAAVMGQMEVVMTTRVTEISAAAVPDEVFAVPAGYTRKQERP